MKVVVSAGIVVDVVSWLEQTERLTSWHCALVLVSAETRASSDVYMSVYIERAACINTVLCRTARALMRCVRYQNRRPVDRLKSPIRNRLRYGKPCQSIISNARA